MSAPEPFPMMFPLAPLLSTAAEDGRCARRRVHRIHRGDPVGLVPGIGWCCVACCS
jgi:hypothetical protein